jgi:hypothetical protein
MGFNRRKMGVQRAAAAEKAAAARRATEAQILEDAGRLVAAWNERQAKRMPMLFSPTIGCPAAQAASTKKPTMMDGFIKLAYGDTPPQKTANLRDAIQLSYETLLGKLVGIAEVKTIATQLYNGPLPIRPMT